MITPKCDKCGKEMETFGALVLSPPQTFANNSCGRIVDKYHICADCWNALRRWIDIEPYE